MAKLKRKLILWLLFPIMLSVIFGGSVLALAQGPPQSGGPPKVDIFAKELTNNAILVTWENPSDTEDNILFLYQISRDVNKTDIFTPIFD